MIRPTGNGQNPVSRGGDGLSESALEPAPLAPPSSQPSETETHQKRRAGFGHRNQRPACGYGIEAGAGEVRVDVVERGSERIAQSCGIGKDRAGQVRVGQVRDEQVRVGQIRAGQARERLQVVSRIREVSGECVLDGINNRPIIPIFGA
jgi:hypothetical protein